MVGLYAYDEVSCVHRCAHMLVKKALRTSGVIIVRMMGDMSICGQLLVNAVEPSIYLDTIVNRASAVQAGGQLTT